MAKRGRKPNPLNTTLLDALNEEENDLLDWDALFDLYNYFEKSQASQSLLKKIDRLISKSAPIQDLVIRNIIDELTSDISPSYGYLYMLSLLKLELKFSKASPQKTITKTGLILMTSRKIVFIQRRAVRSAIMKITQYNNTASSKKILAQLNVWKSNLIKKPNVKLVSESQIDRLRFTVGLKRSEASWIMENLKGFGDKICQSEYKHFFKSGKTSLKFPSTISREEISFLELLTFEKILRNGSYNKKKTEKQKIAFIKNAFYLRSLDYLKTLPKLDYVEISTPIQLDKISKKDVTYSSLNKTKTQKVDVKIFKAQKRIKVTKKKP